MSAIERDGAMPLCPGGEDRLYVRAGRIVRCYRVPCGTARPDASTRAMQDSPLFTVTLETEAQAEQLLSDLYYGEYTGS